MKIDIVSDVVCPWCIVGYKQLEKALEQSQINAEIHWQPFELNPGMPVEGQNLQEHISEKYGSTKAQSDENRQRLSSLGEELSFTFNFSDKSRMVNTFKAHQLLHWAGLQSQQLEHKLKLALFAAYFTDQRDVNDDHTLLAAALSVGLETNETLKVLSEEPYASEVRVRQKHWVDSGTTGVPSMIFCDKYLVTGAQGVDNYAAIIKQILTDEESTID